MVSGYLNVVSVSSAQMPNFLGAQLSFFRRVLLRTQGANTARQRLMLLSVSLERIERGRYCENVPAGPSEFDFVIFLVST